MKIESIRVKNLASLEGTFEVDFTQEPLKSAGIFAIAGSTGAGKSTLLDALCLALYDRTPRFAVKTDSFALQDGAKSSIRQDDVRNILRRGTGEGYAEVDFVGVDGHRYRSNWSVRRAGNKPNGSLQAQKMQVTDLTINEELKGTKTELLDQLWHLIGLSYEQFTRTVLLAQNDFATFLKSRGSEKAELLEKLTGTEIYSLISREIFNRWRTSENDLKLATDALSIIPILSEEELTELAIQKKSSTEALTKGKEAEGSLDNQKKLVSDYRNKSIEKIKKLELLENIKLKHSNAELEFKQKGEEIEAFLQKCEEIKPQIVRATKLDTLIGAKHKELEDASKRLKDSSGSMEKAVTELEKSKVKLTKVFQLIEGLLKDRDSQIGVAQLNDEAITQLLAKENQPIEVLQEEQDAKVAQLKAYDIEAINKEQQNNTSKKQRVEQAIKDLTELLEYRKSLSELQSELSKSEAAYQSKEGNLQRLKSLFEKPQLAVAKSVEALRQQLKDGEHCPVCGSTSHPYFNETAAIENLYAETKKEYEEALEESKQLNTHVTRIKSQIESASQRVAALEKALAFCPEEQQDLGNFKEYLQGINDRIKELSEKVTSYRLLYDQYQVIATQLTKKRNEYGLLKDRLSEFKLIKEQTASFKSQADTIQKQALTDKSAYDTINTAYTALTEERKALLNGMSTEKAQQALQAKEKELKAALEMLRTKKDAVSQELSTTLGIVEQLTTDISKLEATYKDIEEPDSLSQKLAEVSHNNAELQKAISTIEVKLKLNEENKQKRSSKEVELKAQTEITSRWAKLNELIGSADGAKFKKIAQSYTLNLLLKHTNKHLGYLSRRYKLRQIPDTLGLQIIDGDMCDEVRTVYSLSGGESFLISLALALGLSSLSSNNLKVESLFIDEGFGSLDADTLRAAMEALEMLQMQGRKIGVISHVQEMSERISVQVQLTKSTNGKSVMTVVG